MVMLHERDKQANIAVGTAGSWGWANIGAASTPLPVGMTIFGIATGKAARHIGRMASVGFILPELL